MPSVCTSYHQSFEIVTPCVQRWYDSSMDDMMCCEIYWYAHWWQDVFRTLRTCCVHRCTSSSYSFASFIFFFLGLSNITLTIQQFDAKEDRWWYELKKALMVRRGDRCHDLCYCDTMCSAMIWFFHGWHGLSHGHWTQSGLWCFTHGTGWFITRTLDTDARRWLLTYTGWFMMFPPWNRMVYHTDIGHRCKEMTFNQKHH